MRVVNLAKCNAVWKKYPSVEHTQMDSIVMSRDYLGSSIRVRIMKTTSISHCNILFCG